MRYNGLRGFPKYEKVEEEYGWVWFWVEGLICLLFGQGMSEKLPCFTRYEDQGFLGSLHGPFLWALKGEPLIYPLYAVQNLAAHTSEPVNIL